MKLLTSLFVLTFAANLTPGLYADQSDDDAGDHGVFVMTNSVQRNEVISYSRDRNGLLIEREHYATGGRGSGGTIDPLGSQGSLTLSQDGSLLLAVNASSGTISAFRVNGWRLYLAQVISSRGSAPVAVAQHNDLVYVVNSAGNSNVNGFRLDEAGQMVEIPKSTRYLSATTSGASSLAFSPDGRFLLVTERVTNVIDVFSVKSDGTLSKATVTKDPLPGLFDVIFSPEGVALIVQAGPAGDTHASSVSSYLVENGGTLAPITSRVPTLGSGACWVALTPDGRFAFVSNSLSGTISGFAIGSSGNITAVDGTVLGTLPAGSVNLDVVVSQDSKYAYTLNAGTGTIGIFAVRSNGTLKLAGLVRGLKPLDGVEGLAAF